MIPLPLYRTLAAAIPERRTTRFYDTSGGDAKFLGVGSGLVKGHTFEIAVMAIYKKPTSADIKYSIEPE